MRAERDLQGVRVRGCRNTSFGQSKKAKNPSFFATYTFSNRQFSVVLNCTVAKWTTGWICMSFVFVSRFRNLIGKSENLIPIPMIQSERCHYNESGSILAYNFIDSHWPIYGRIWWTQIRLCCSQSSKRTWTRSMSQLEKQSTQVDYIQLTNTAICTCFAWNHRRASSPQWTLAMGTAPLIWILQSLCLWEPVHLLSCVVLKPYTSLWFEVFAELKRNVANSCIVELWTGEKETTNCTWSNVIEVAHRGLSLSTQLFKLYVFDPVYSNLWHIDDPDGNQSVVHI